MRAAKYAHHPIPDRRPPITATYHCKIYLFPQNSSLSATIPRMRSLFILLAATTFLAQVTRQSQYSETTENLRGVSVVSNQIVWASGAHGTYLRTTDGGRTWLTAQGLGAPHLDFRGVVAFSADEAFLMSSGPGDQSRIYRTLDAGQHWQL